MRKKLKIYISDGQMVIEKTLLKKLFYGIFLREFMSKGFYERIYLLKIFDKFFKENFLREFPRDFLRKIFERFSKGNL